jgi:hypothetical protein
MPRRIRVWPEGLFLRWKARTGRTEVAGALSAQGLSPPGLAPPAILVAMLLAPPALPTPQEAPTAQTAPALECESWAQRVQTGDLVFRTEPGWVSRAVLHAQGDPRYSHVGIVVRGHDGPRVFHAEIDPDAQVEGVVAQDLCTYLRRSTRAAVKRLRTLDEPGRRAIAQAVLDRGFPGFNWRFVWEPADGSVYCTQYVWQVIQHAQAGRDLAHPDAGSILTTGQLLDSDALVDVGVTGVTWDAR